MSDWDAAKYHRISDPQLAWGRAVATRLAPSAGERILDLGCGTGRLTQEIAQLPEIFIVGMDYSEAMLEQVHRHDQTPSDRPLPVYVRGDGAALPFARAFDAVFSAAVFHWIPDHDQLFRSAYDALKPGGRLVAQCGGAGNLDRLYGRARALMASAAYREYFPGWRDYNHFENVADTERRLVSAGFTGLDVSLVSSPVTFDSGASFTEFTAAVCLRHHLDRLPAETRPRFLSEITNQAIDDNPPLTLDYWRLNIFARKGGE